MPLSEQQQQQREAERRETGEGNICLFLPVARKRLRGASPAPRGWGLPSARHRRAPRELSQLSRQGLRARGSALTARLRSAREGARGPREAEGGAGKLRRGCPGGPPSTGTGPGPGAGRAGGGQPRGAVCGAHLQGQALRPAYWFATDTVRKQWANSPRW